MRICKRPEIIHQSNEKLVREGQILTYALLLAVLFLFPFVPYSAHGSAQTKSLPVAMATIANNNPNLRGNAYDIALWRYSEIGGPPQLASSANLAAAGQVALFDSSLSTFTHSSPYVHYSVVILETLRDGTIAQLANYHWTSQLNGYKGNTGGYVDRTEILSLNQLSNGRTSITSNSQVVPYMAPTSYAPVSNTNSTPTRNTNTASSLTVESDSWPTSILKVSVSHEHASTIQPAFQTPGCYYYEVEYCWVAIKTWNNVWTTIGEASGSGYMSDYFSYGVQSSSQIATAASSGGGGWSVSGSWTVTNTQSQSTNWPVLHCCSNWLTNSQFNYEEDQMCFPYSDYTGNYCTWTNSYQIYAPGWDGSAEAWLNAGISNSSPGDCQTLSTIQTNGWSYGTFAAGSGTTISNDNGFQYSSAVTVGGTIGDNTGSVTLSDTTAYNYHTSQAFSFGTQYSYYYLYSGTPPNNGVNQYPVIFSTNTAAHCGP